VGQPGFVHWLIGVRLWCGMVLVQCGVVWYSVVRTLDIAHLLVLVLPPLQSVSLVLSHWLIGLDWFDLLRL
jgi:hypothetical protein